ncbi:hypothetical protein TL16_g04369 [Triparma laevis f. inornata]|uniref:Uncharacterized protein n=1 Tax=Triparma laevis f. inornata TaxID=1714386 RepID=A0A9W7E4U7_9STRA|nr:hypothetical protein TL16_g04369 [Triparma laevis f. inornata]
MRSFSHMGNLYKNDARGARRRRRSVNKPAANLEPAAESVARSLTPASAKKVATPEPLKAGFDWSAASNLFSCVSETGRSNVFSCAAQSGEQMQGTPTRPKGEVNMLDLISTPEH